MRVWRRLAGSMLAVQALACSPAADSGREGGTASASADELAASGSGSASAEGAGPSLEPVPELDLEQLASEVAAELGERRDVLADRLARYREPGAGSASDQRRRELADAFARAGELYHAYGLLEAAAPCYRNAIALGAASARLHYLLATVEQRLGETESAARHLQAALEKVPDDFRTPSAGPGEVPEEFRTAPGGKVPEEFRGSSGGRSESVSEDFPGASGGSEKVPEEFRGASGGRSVKVSEDFPRVTGGSEKVPESFPGRVSEEFPAVLAAVLRLAEIRLAEGRMEAAGSLFERALGLPGGEGPARFGLGRVAAGVGEDREAIAHFERVLELEPRAAAVPPLLALAYRRLGDVEEARRWAGRSGDRELRVADPVLAEIDRLGTGQGFLLARAEAALLAGDFEASIGLYRQAVAADPADPEARHSLAAALARAGRRDEAIAELRAALELDPESAPLERRLSELLAESGRLDAAVAAARRAVEIDPTGVRNRLLLARVLGRAGRLEAALAEYDAALDLDPGSAEARIGRAMTVATLGNTAQAIAELETAIAREPRRAAYRLHLADLRAADGDSAKAEERYRQALELDPDPGERVAARVGLARLAAAAGDTADAEAGLRAALAEDPDHAEAHFRLGQLLAGTGRMEESLAHFRAVLAREPRHEPAWLLESTGLVLLGRYRDARDRLEEGLAALPESAPLTHTLSRLLATCPEPGVRDGGRALELANRVLAREASLETAATVAMALAELGRFTDAVAWQERLLGEARGRADPATLASLEADLERYRSGEPVRAPWQRSGAL